jgi:hypothetical protein
MGSSWRGAVSGRLNPREFGAEREWPAAIHIPARTIRGEDQPWFPTKIRDLATDYIHFLETKFVLHRPVVPLMAEALRLTKGTRVVGLGSGGGGPMAALLQALAADVRHSS